MCTVDLFSQAPFLDTLAHLDLQELRTAVTDLVLCCLSFPPSSLRQEEEEEGGEEQEEQARQAALSSLSLHSCSALTPIGLLAVAEAPFRLTSLDLSFVRSFNDTTLLHLLEKQESLEELALWGCPQLHLDAWLAEDGAGERCVTVAGFIGAQQDGETYHQDV